MKDILVVDDHPLVRMMLCKIISQLPFPINCHQAGTFSETEDSLSLQPMDLVVLDLSIPGGREAEMIACLRKIQTGVPILIFSGRDEQIHAPYYINQGANGYVSKLCDEQEICLAITKVLNGQIYLRQEIKNLIFFSMVDKKQFKFNPIHMLTLREKEIVKLLLKGCTVKETAQAMALNISTVSSLKTRILDKLQIDNLMELAKLMVVYNDELVIDPALNPLKYEKV